MPCHPDRVRRNYTKPTYNHTRGDSVLTPCPACRPDPPAWRRPSDNNAEQLERRAGGRVARIRGTLHPTDPTYCAEPLDIDDARWLLAQLDVAMDLLTSARDGAA